MVIYCLCMRPKALNYSLLVKILFVCLALLLSQLLFLKSANAQTKPFIRVNGADISAGGGSDPNCRGNYYSPASGDNREGGILTFTRGINGSGSQFGALSLGLIEGTGVSSNADKGFASQLARSGSNQLSFANSGNPAFGSINWGGLFNSTFCSPDYYSKSSTFTTNRNLSNFNVADYSGPELGLVYNPGPILTMSGGVIPASKDKTVFVNGNVYITSNITYAGYSTVNEIPKFALVARGNIYVAPGVTQLDGFYVAQPNGGAGGEFVSCAVAPPALPTPPELRNPCGNNRLVVNGAVSASKVHLLRTIGDGITGGVSAEEFNYTAAMVIGGGFFNDGNQNNTVEFDSVISLPPIF